MSLNYTMIHCLKKKQKSKSTKYNTTAWALVNYTCSHSRFWQLESPAQVLVEAGCSGYFQAWRQCCVLNPRRGRATLRSQAYFIFSSTRD